MSEQLVSDIYPEPTTLLGKRLVPLSLGHVFLLQRFGCYPAQGYSGLITGVIVCSRPVREVLPTLEDKWLGLKLWVWGRRLGKFNPFEKVLAFNAYLEAHSRRPELMPFDSFEETGLPGAPFLQHLRVCLLARCGWTREMIDEEPLSQAFWDYYTYWEIEDRVRIAIPDSQEAQVDYLKEADAKHAERLAKANALVQSTNNQAPSTREAPGSNNQTPHPDPLPVGEGTANTIRVADHVFGDGE